MSLITQASTAPDVPIWVYVIALLLGNMLGFGLLWWRKRTKQNHDS